MGRAHYIVRVGNEGLSPKVSETTPNHWHYLSAQNLWGFPKRLKNVNVRAKFEADMQSPRDTVYIWFLCNGSVGGRGRFVQVAIGRRRSARGPIANGNPSIPAAMMAGLQQDFDHWFEWQPVSSSAAFHNQLRQIPVPVPHYIPTLRRVTPEHVSFPAFQALINAEQRRVSAAHGGDVPPQTAIQTAPPAAVRPVISQIPQVPEQPVRKPFPPPPPPTPSTSTTSRPAPRAIEIELENIRAEAIDPHGPGHIYLIHQEGSSSYKIGMSLDPAVRLRTLQTGNPKLLSLVTTRAVEDMRSAEVRLHRRFEGRRVETQTVREWFDFGGVLSEVLEVLEGVR
ncbi:hypothetical protein MMC25_003829 [Agyrium rufum]|nr:hypothetical protein [Agyrium rufum]